MTWWQIILVIIVAPFIVFFFSKVAMLGCLSALKQSGEESIDGEETQGK